jgi:hypothetical protein
MNGATQTMTGNVRRTERMEGGKHDGAAQAMIIMGMSGATQTMLCNMVYTTRIESMDGAAQAIINTNGIKRAWNMVWETGCSSSVEECWLASTRKENSAGADNGVEDGCICRQGHAGWLDGIAGCRYGM